MSLTKRSRSAIGLKSTPKLAPLTVKVAPTCAVWPVVGLIVIRRAVAPLLATATP